jgi:hypothetical protein
MMTYLQDLLLLKSDLTEQQYHMNWNLTFSISGSDVNRDMSKLLFKPLLLLTSS